MTSILTDEMRRKMAAINAGLHQAPTRPSCTRVFRYEGDKVVEATRPGGDKKRSMFPYYSDAMAVDPQEVGLAKDTLRAHGLFVEFDGDGRPRIDSTKQHRDIARALGIWDGRDGYGGRDEDGNHVLSGRPEAERQMRGREKVRRLREKLESMPETVDLQQFQNFLDEEWDLE